MIKSALDLGSEERVREQVGEHSFAMKMTETIVSVIERAAKRAAAQKKG
jgi:hypothetical protein